MGERGSGSNPHYNYHPPPGGPFLGKTVFGGVLLRQKVTISPRLSWGSLFEGPPRQAPPGGTFGGGGYVPRTPKIRLNRLPRFCSQDNKNQIENCNSSQAYRQFSIKLRPAYGSLIRPAVLSSKRRYSPFLIARLIFPPIAPPASYKEVDCR